MKQKICINETKYVNICIHLEELLTKTTITLILYTKKANNNYVESLITLLLFRSIESHLMRT